MSHTKIAKTQYPVSDLVKNRWSARSFSPRQIDKDILYTLFEAATWAASSNNEQPWQYLYAYNGTEAFDKIWACLMSGNQPWAKNASVLVISIARKTFLADGKPNKHARYDVGAANATLMLEATKHQIYGHQMGGFYADKIIETFSLTEDQDPVVVIALGYLDDADKLDEPFKTRELTPRTRKPLAEVIKPL
jgi:nitroreductase